MRIATEWAMHTYYMHCIVDRRPLWSSWGRVSIAKYVSEGQMGQSHEWR